MVVVLVAALALLILDTLVVPKGWRQVQIGEERSAVIERLGSPSVAAWDLKGDEWTKSTGIGCIAMRIMYRVDGDRITIRSVRWSHWIGPRDFHFRLKEDESI